MVARRLRRTRVALEDSGGRCASGQCFSGPSTFAVPRRWPFLSSADRGEEADPLSGKGIHWARNSFLAGWPVGGVYIERIGQV